MASQVSRVTLESKENGVSSVFPARGERMDLRDQRVE